MKNRYPIQAIVEAFFLLGAGVVALTDGLSIRAFVRPRQRGAYDVLGPDGYLIVVGWLVMLVAVVYAFSTLRRPSVRTTERSGVAGLRGIFLTLVAMAAYVALIPAAGYLLATVLFLLVAFRVAGVTSWLVSVLLSVVLGTVFFLVFVRFAGMPLPHGMLGIG